MHIICPRPSSVVISVVSSDSVTVTSYRDLGITINCELSSSPHINDIVTKAHRRANMSHRCFVSRNINLLTLVRPLLERNNVLHGRPTLNVILN